MPIDPATALRAAHAPVARPLRSPHAGVLLIAGATGPLGQELVRRLVGAHRFERTVLLARDPMHDGLPSVRSQVVPGADMPIDAWPPIAADTALVAFDPPRLYHQRERALWTPEPAQLPALARWLRTCGVHTLAVVLPHAQGRLPEALKRGLANLDEHAIVALGFERVLFIRSAQKPPNASLRRLGDRLAAWMLSIFRFMVPPSEQPVRAVKVAELVDVALRLAPPGVHVASPEQVWRAAQGDATAVAREWLGLPAAAAATASDLGRGVRR